jgi:RNA polymerase sigma-70 factor, ECF subfamily
MGNTGQSDYDVVRSLDKECAIIFLMRKYGEEIKRFNFTIVKNWSQAEDLTQDVFLSIYQK